LPAIASATAGGLNGEPAVAEAMAGRRQAAWLAPTVREGWRETTNDECRARNRKTVKGARGARPGFVPMNRDFRLRQGLRRDESPWQGEKESGDPKVAAILPSAWLERQV